MAVAKRARGCLLEEVSVKDSCSVLHTPGTQLVVVLPLLTGQTTFLPTLAFDEAGD